MAQLFVFGHVTADLIPKESQSKSTYVCFNLAENIGYGEKKRTIYYQVWAWGDDALRLIRLGIKKSSFIWLTGSVELVDCTDKDGKTRTKRLKVYLDNCGFVPNGQNRQMDLESADKMDAMTDTGVFPPGDELNGDRLPLPE